MTSFQQTASFLTLIWFLIILIRFRRSSLILIGGLVAIGLYTITALGSHQVTLLQLGLGAPNSWLFTIGLAIAWLALMLVYSPVADRLASRWFEKPPTLESFHVIQESRGKLIAGIIAVWLLGGVLEELIARGIVLKSVEALLTQRLLEPLATGVAVCIAAAGAGLMHSYQGPRAVVIITQLSFLIGVLFVISGYNLWAVMICHGLYDTIAFIRFATKKSRYSNLDGNQMS